MQASAEQRTPAQSMEFKIGEMASNSGATRDTVRGNIALTDQNNLLVNSAMILKHLPGWIRVVSKEGQVVYASDSLQSALGVMPNTGCCEALGLPHRTEECISWQTVATGQPQVRHIRLGRFYCRIAASPLRDEQGEMIGSVELLQDVTELKRLERALIEKNQVLELVNESIIELNHDLENAQSDLKNKNTELSQANLELRSLDQLKDEFISIVSHELRAPLTSIKGTVGLILNGMVGQIPERPRQFLEVCLRNTNRLIRMVNELLDLARIESGRLVLHFETFPLEGFIGEVIKELQPLAQESEAEIQCTVPPGSLIEADRDGLAQLLTNLISNALHYAHSCVHVSVVRTERGFEFAVTDNGIGIPHDQLEQIFEKFAQVKGATTQHAQGTGLGLSIARAIVEEHGGRIRAESEEGKGSTFRFWILQPPGKETREIHSSD